ncbi:MAG: helix-turn-helix domain-containing protein [Clostridiales bacterium]|jgi:transcriptional regulator with XRE-family HTH domain|nr:helix-turn-helix domain-containing protein [Clostridiales bacterium]
MEIGERLKDLRKSKNLLQKDLASLLTVRNTTVSAWEKGDNEPDIKTIKQLAVFFNVTSDYLIGLENDDGTKNF